MAQGKFISYYRVSTKSQGESGLGIEAQKAAVKAYLNGGDWELKGEYEEVVSGTRKGAGKRVELEKAIAACKLHKATLVIAKFDRIHRNVAALTALMESGIDMVACDNPTANKMTITILAAVAENEADMISTRTKAALAAKKERGEPTGAACWKKVDTGGNFTGVLTAEDQARGRTISVLANKEKADEAAAMICAHIAEIKQELGELSQNAVARELNGRGITTGRGKQWTATAVRNAMKRIG